MNKILRIWNLIGSLRGPDNSRTLVLSSDWLRWIPCYLETAHLWLRWPLILIWTCHRKWGYWELKISQYTGYFIYWRKCITGWMIIIISWSRLSNMLYKRVAEEPGCQRAGLLPERYPFFLFSPVAVFTTFFLLSRFISCRGAGV